MEEKVLEKSTFLIIEEEKREELYKKLKDWIESESDMIYKKIRCAIEHLEKFRKNISPTNVKACLELGPGRGNLAPDIKRFFNPDQYYCVDIVKEALDKTKARAESEGIKFIETHQCDVSIEGLTYWPDNFFDVVVANKFLYLIPGGWKPIVEEIKRVLKPGGMDYGGEMIKEKFFVRVLLTHLIPEFLKHPYRSLSGLKFRKKISKILKLAIELGAETVNPEELKKFLEELNFNNTEIIYTYWGNGIVFKTQNSKSLS